MLSMNWVNTVFGFFITLNSFKFSAAFLWDEENVGRLFFNYKDILDDILSDVELYEKTCVKQFHYFVNHLMLEDEWAVESESLPNRHPYMSGIILYSNLLLLQC